jgi:hypothetical protein
MEIHFEVLAIYLVTLAPRDSLPHSLTLPLLYSLRERLFDMRHVSSGFY